MNHFSIQLESHLSENIKKTIYNFSKSINLSNEDANKLSDLAFKLSNEIYLRQNLCLKIENEADKKYLKSITTQEAFKQIISDGTETSPSPLIYDKLYDALYFKKEFLQEKRIIDYILTARSKFCTKLSPLVENIINSKEIFSFSLNNEQKEAIRKIIGANFSIVSGGPGTGKTTLLFYALLCFFKESPAKKVSIVTPSGKSAQRIKESFNEQIKILNDSAKNAFTKEIALINEIQPKTIHRAFSIYSTKKTILADDLIIIDEASMVSQITMATIIRSIKDEAKLVLLGDKNQLSSVDPGNIFGELCKSEKIKELQTTLITSNRFSNKKIIGRLCNSILDEETETIANLFNIYKESGIQSQKESVTIEKSSQKIFSKLITFIKSDFPSILIEPTKASSPKELLNAAQNTKILTPLREGILGAESINKQIKNIFFPDEGEIYHGMPISILENDYINNLFNGDTGIIFKEDNIFFAYFNSIESPDKPLRRFNIATLSKYEPGYALTIHKSQGSEYKHLIVVYPYIETVPIFTKELFYTAVSRYKESKENEKSYDFSTFRLICNFSTPASQILKSSHPICFLKERLDKKNETK